MKIELNLLNHQDQLKIKQEEAKKWIFDPIRKKYVVLQPEELVRQLLVFYLLEIGYKLNKIAVEKGLLVNGLSRRFDALIYNEDFLPKLMIECKAPQVKLDNAVFEQIARYNIPLQVPFLVVTNGLHTYCARIYQESESFEFLSKIPGPEELNSK